ncbi:hypothetical protein APUTEX25_003311 [Auxenochlorella protothecoides]|uniref:Uncharacterized protein n=1 Tax=Auxenochlorella protothecoides TaxID=3075 RepID=A0A3M7KUE0_AUXPR|nr:hypothetical protein APUTEX25_003311 [Auxenochlorella protothecoides]|eukprot:RMZ53489.1 hypothetical protein APUTEX25_003311 [Auxenochlorella protothecoides]
MDWAIERFLRVIDQFVFLPYDYLAQEAMHAEQSSRIRPTAAQDSRTGPFECRHRVSPPNPLCLRPRGEFGRVCGTEGLPTTADARLPARSGPLRTLAALRVALQPRLLAFVVLAAALGTLPGLSDLDGLHQACALAGCLSHKAALFGQVYAATKPRALTQEELLRPPPPRILPLEDDRA